MFSDFCFIGGGTSNSIRGGSEYGFIGGGAVNSVSSHFSFLGNGAFNSLASSYSFLGLGYYCSIQSGAYGSFLGGGEFNLTRDQAHDSFLGGGYHNSVGGAYSVVPGGQYNSAAGSDSFAAGRRAKAMHDGAFVWSDSTDADFVSTTSNQFSIRASGGARFVTSGAGLNVDGNLAIGVPTAAERLDIAGGNIIVRGPNSFAYGTPAGLFLGDGNNYVKAVSGHGLKLGTYLASDGLVMMNGGNVGIGTTNPVRRLHVMDGTGNGGSIQIGAQVPGADPKLIYFGDGNYVYLGENFKDDTLEFHAGRFYFSNGYLGVGVSDPTYRIQVAGGAYCDGSQWQNYSDRNRKENFAPVDSKDILEKLAALPVSTWKYQSETNAVKHLGPTAQDFHAAFGLGASDTSIGTVDEGGVALAAIKGLHQSVKEKDAKIADLEKRLVALEQLVQHQLDKNEMP